ncbi:hypothetical protein F8388_005841 [Cannabis sativa]|uniref:Uncharacterized protein n=1 Tax=Cannabis sativa TaxID=3483 RepID=A0A7J6HFW4_CANSA|nr:hypothetical protein F8388_005841 [Cannabis sativa]
MIARNQEFKSRNRGKQSPAPSSVSLPALEVEKDLQEKALSMLGDLWLYSRKDFEAVVIVWWSVQIFVI